jgi:hypothetical protein
MPNRRLTRKTIKGKDGVHPGSRKGQIRPLEIVAQADKQRISSSESVFENISSREQPKHVKN